MHKIIYRKSDRQVVATVHDRSSAEYETEALEIQLDEIVANPNQGGAKEDYAVIEIADSRAPKGKLLSVNSDLEAEFIEDPNTMAKQDPGVAKELTDRAAAKTKLKDLGLTDDEISALLSPLYADF